MHSHMFKTCQNSTPHLPLSFSLSFSVKPTLSNLLFFFQCDTDISLSLIDISFFTVVKVSLKNIIMPSSQYVNTTHTKISYYSTQLPRKLSLQSSPASFYFTLFLLYNKVHLLQLYTVISSLFFIFF